MPAGTMSVEQRLQLLLHNTRMHFKNIKSDVNSHFGRNSTLTYSDVLSFLAHHHNTKLEVGDVLAAVTLGEEAARTAMYKKASEIYHSGELYEQWRDALLDSNQGSHRFRKHKFA